MSVRVQGHTPVGPLERLVRDFETALPQLPEEVVPRVARRRAAEQLRHLGWPESRDEQWRYLKLSAYERVGSFIPSALANQRAHTPDRLRALLTSLALPPPPPGFERLTFVDGLQVEGNLTNAVVQNPAVYAGALAFPRALEPWLPEQRLGFLNDMFACSAAALRIQGEAAIELVFVRSAEPGDSVSYPRLQIELGPQSRVQVIERHLGAAPGNALVCAGATVELARAAQLTHYRLQQCDAQTAFADTLTARLAEGASYRVRQITVGAASSRTTARVRLAGPDAALDWQAIAVGRDEQVHDSILRVEHAAARTRTEEAFRGIAEQRARVAFGGHIEIESCAAGAQARQSLRGLIEAQGEVDLRPQLEIHTDEVSAQHGATTGRLDENLLFYLLSRGIDRSTARTLLKWAFLNDVLRQIELPTLRAEAEHTAAGRLQDVLAVGALT